MFKRTISFMAAAFAAAISFAQTLPADPEVLHGKLDNGLTYYIRHNEIPEGRAEFYLVTDVGAIQEVEGEDGLAHFLEHMCFNGLKNLPGKMMLDYLQGIGAEFGRNINAGTGVEHTSYMLNNIPVSREGIVDTCLLVLHDWSHFVTCDPQEIESERGVILEEKRTRNDAGWRMFEKSLPYYYGESKYSRCNLIGSEETLKTFKSETLVNFYRRWYRPDLQAVIVVGDISPETIREKMVKLFADIPAPVNPEPKIMPSVEIRDTTIVGILTDKESTATSVEFICKTGAPAPKEINATPEGYAKDIIHSIIHQAMQERFDEIASKADAPFTGAYFGIFDLCQTCEAFNGKVSCENSKAVPAFAAFLTEVERMKRYGFSEDEVERVKRNIIKGAKDAVNGKDTRKNENFIDGYINSFIDGYPFMTPEDEYALTEAVCGSIDATIVNQFITRKFRNGEFVILYKGPDKEGVVHPSEGRLEEVLDSIGKADIECNFAAAVGSDIMEGIKVKTGKVVRTEEGRYGSTVWTLNNTMRVVALPTEYKKDQIIIELRRDGGRNIVPTEDLPSLEGNVLACYNSNRGLASYSNTTLGKMLSGKTVNYSSFVTNIRNGIKGGCSSSDIETLLQLIYLEFTAPRYDKEEWNTSIRQIQSVLPNMVSTPDYAFNEHLYDNIYGGNPRVFQLSQEKLDAADFRTFRKYHSQMFGGAGGYTLYIIGDFKTEELRPLVEKYCGGIKKGGKKAALKPERFIKMAERPMEDVFSQKMTTPKVSAALLWNTGTDYNVCKAVYAQAAELILRDVYVHVLREQEGGTYGASCNYSVNYEPYPHSVLQVFFDTNVGQQERLRALAKQCIEDLVANGPSDAQLNQAVGIIRKNLPEKRINNGWWKSCLIIGDKLGIDYDAEYEKAIESINAESIKLILKEMISAGNLVETVMLPAE